MAALPGRRRRWLALAGLVAAGTAIGAVQASARPTTPAAVPAPRATDLIADRAVDPAVSGDGRFVLYAATPSVADGRKSTVWVHDRADGSTVELTVPAAGLRAGDSVKPAISADGCVAVVVTQMAFDLFRDDDNGSRWDVYRLTLPHCGGALGDWELVSARDGGGFGASAADDASPDHTPAVSGSGAVVAYVNRFSLDAPTVTSVRVADLTIPLGEPGRNRPVAGTPTRAPNTTFRYRGLRDPAISDDGLIVAFTSDAVSDSPEREWAPGPAGGAFATSQVFVWDRTDTDPLTAVTRISEAAGVPADGSAGRPAVSGDGRFVAFESTSTNLVAGVRFEHCGPVCPAQVYRHDRFDGSTVLVSRAPDVDPDTGWLVAADAGASQPAITADGTEVVFVTRATNLLATRPAAGGEVGDGDIVVADLARGGVQRLSTAADGVTAAPAANARPRTSATGRVVVFDTLAGATLDVLGGTGMTTARQIAVVTRTPALSLADLDVGSSGLGFPGPEWFISVVNDGPSTFVPSIVESSNPEFAVSGGTCTLGIPVPPGGACTVQVMLTPAELGPTSGTLRVAEDGFGAVEVEANLFGAGGASWLATNPAGVDLPPVDVGTPGEPAQIEVFNVGFGPLRIDTLEVGGVHAADVEIAGTTCRVELAIGESCTVDLEITPADAGRRTAHLRIGSEQGGYTTVMLSTVGTRTPTVTLSAAEVTRGTRLGVQGAGYAPGTTVTLQWADGSGRRAALVTDESGAFTASLLVGPAERAGQRTLVAQGADGTAASADVTVRTMPLRPAATSPTHRTP